MAPYTPITGLKSELCEMPRQIEDNLRTPLSTTFFDASLWVTDFDSDLDEATKKREVPIGFDHDSQAQFEEDLKWLTRDQDITVWIHYKEVGSGAGGGGGGGGGGDEHHKHLGGYALHGGGYPHIELPNILPSEFVLSPYTTWLMERAMGRLDQGKMREVAEGGKRVEMRFYGPVTIDRSFASHVGLDDILRTTKV